MGYNILIRMPADQAITLAGDDGLVDALRTSMTRRIPLEVFDEGRTIIVNPGQIIYAAISPDRPATSALRAVA